LRCIFKKFARVSSLKLFICIYDFEFALRYCGEEFSTVWFVYDSTIEDDYDTGIGFAADKPSEALFKFYDCGGQLVVEEGVLAELSYLFESSCEQGLVWDGEREADDNYVAEGGSGDVDALPEAVGAEQCGAGV